LYADVYGVFPETLSDLVPEYLEKIPTDPTTGEAYTYTNYAEGADYEVCTILETLEEYDGVYCEFGLDLGANNSLELDGFGTSEELLIEEATSEE